MIIITHPINSCIRLGFLILFDERRASLKRLRQLHQNLGVLCCTSTARNLSDGDTHICRLIIQKRNIRFVLFYIFFSYCILFCFLLFLLFVFLTFLVVFLTFLAVFFLTFEKKVNWTNRYLYHTVSLLETSPLID